MRNFKINKIVFTVLAFLLSSKIFAQGDIGFGDDVVDNTPTAAPIDNFMPVAIFLALLYALIVYFRKEKRILK